MKSFPVRIQFLLILICLTTATIATPATTQAEVSSSQAILYDSVTIDSRSFPPGHPDCSVGVYISNSVNVTAIVLPIEFRSVTPGAYISATVDLTFSEASRLRNSSLGEVPSADECPLADRVFRRYPTETQLPCVGSGTQAFATAAAQIDFLSPDAVLYITACTPPEFLKDSVNLKPGVDTVPSAHLVFGISTTTGTFVIDTTCVRPSNRLLYADPDLNAFTPDFRRSVVTIECGPCRCHADPWCDGVTNIVDVILTIDRAFRGDALHCAPYVVNGDAALDGPTDFDCSGATTVVDVVKAINVCFDAADPATEFCQPCP